MSKAKRDRLFKRGRVFFRPLKLIEGDRYSKDIGYLWVSHQKKPCHWFPKDCTQEQFAKKLEEMSQWYEYYIAEDRNKEYADKGPIAFLGVASDGWKLEPHVEFFGWSTVRNKLNTVVSFLQMFRYKKIGVIMIYSLEDSKNLFDKACDYGVLHKVGKIVNGDPRGDIWLYSVKGEI